VVPMKSLRWGKGGGKASQHTGVGEKGPENILIKKFERGRCGEKDHEGCVETR